MVSLDKVGQSAHRTEWSSLAYSGRSQYAAWQHALNSTYCDFDVSVPTRETYSANLVAHSLPSFGVIECVCDPCSATRGGREISRDDPGVLGVQLILAGQENMEIDGERYRLSPNDIVIWDSTRQVDFEVVERLHKISLMLPLQRLKDWLPVPRSKICQVINGRTGSGRLLASFIRSVSPAVSDQACLNGEALGESTMGLLYNAANHFEVHKREKLRNVQLQSIKAYIDQRLDQPTLKLADVAAANRISVRYLHWLFEPIETTAAEYIMERRLELCARDLRNPLMQHRTIGDVCFGWGFMNTTHFSRRFRRQYEASPSEYRARAIGNIAN